MSKPPKPSDICTSTFEQLFAQHYNKEVQANIDPSDDEWDFIPQLKGAIK